MMCEDIKFVSETKLLPSTQLLKFAASQLVFAKTEVTVM